MSDFLTERLFIYVKSLALEKRRNMEKAEKVQLLSGLYLNTNAFVIAIATYILDNKTENSFYFY